MKSEQGRSVRDQCLILERANQIARERGLLEEGKTIPCRFKRGCHGTNCVLMKRSQYLTVHLRSEGKPASPNQVDKFYSALRKHQKIVGGGKTE
jgi:hypothetical protein